MLGDARTGAEGGVRPAPAPSEFAGLMAAGGRALHAGDYERALDRFEAAARANPDHAEPPFYIGLTLNRLGRPEPARLQLTRSADLIARAPAPAGGAAPPAYVRELPFELGWSLVYLRRWAQAAEQLDRFERTSPGRGQTSEFLGRAYLGLGELNRAEAQLRQAIERDPDPARTANLYLTIIEERRQNAAAAHARLADAARAAEVAPDSAVGRLLNQHLGPTGHPPPAGPRWVEFSLGGGFTTDARGSQSTLVDQEGRPSNLALRGRDAAYARVTLDVAVPVIGPADESSASRPAGHRPNQLTVGYRLLADTFERGGDGGEADLMDHYVFIEAEHPIAGPLSLQARLWDQYTLAGDANYRNEIGARVGLLWHCASALVIDGGVMIANDNYLFPTPRDIFLGNHLDQDAWNYTVTAGARWAVPGTPLELRAGYFHVWNDARGADFDYTVDGFYAGRRATPAVWDVTVDMLYARTYESYANPNSSSAPFVRRSDVIDSLTVRLTKPNRCPPS